MPDPDPVAVPDDDDEELEESVKLMRILQSLNDRLQALERAPRRAAQAPPHVYDDAIGWFDTWFSRIFARTDKTMWCEKWQSHPEVMFVIEQLWHTWEIANRQPQPDQALAVWYRDFGHNMFEKITAEDGPFKGCSWGRATHHDPSVTPLTRVP